MPRFTRTELAAAAACAAWAAAFYAPEGAGAIAVVPLLALAVLAYRRRPERAGLGVAAALALAAAAGVPEDNPGGIAAGFTAAFGLGRYAAPRRGLVVLAALVAVLVVPEGAAAIDWVFVTLVLGATWGCGRLVRRRTLAAELAVAEATELADVDPSELAERVIAEERARLAGEALAVARRSVERMRRLAAGAEETLDPARLAAVQEEGRTAVADLRRLLGLLRSEAAGGPGPPAATPRDPAPSRRGPGQWAGAPRVVDAAAAVALGALCVAEVAVFDSSTPSYAVVLSVALVAGVALRRVDAALASLLAAIPAGAAVLLGETLVLGFATPVALGMLAWSAAGDGRARTLGALGILAATVIAVVALDEPENVPILVALLGLAALAGHLFSARRREGEAAAATASSLRAAQRETAERAVRGERLRLARELHDVASHAVGVMVLQAGAAVAQRERDPAAARRAVDTLQRAGGEAIAELDVLFGVLDAGAVGPPGLAAPAKQGELPAALEAVVERIRAAGLDVGLRVPAGLSAEGETAAAALRVVQEALTNALRHAPGSRVDVSVTQTGGTLKVEVSDDGGRPAKHEPGFGLVGLGERVRAVGGELSAGPREAGGFAVSARLPLATAELPA